MTSVVSTFIKMDDERNDRSDLSKQANETAVDGTALSTEDVDTSLSTKKTNKEKLSFIRKFVVLPVPGGITYPKACKNLGVDKSNLEKFRKMDLKDLWEIAQSLLLKRAKGTVGGCGAQQLHQRINHPS